MRTDSRRPVRLIALLAVTWLGALLAGSAAAQLGQPGQPPSLRHAAPLPSDVPAYVLPAPDVERLKQEDSERGQWPMRYGATIPLALSSADSGVWQTLPSGELVWRLRIVSPGAHSLGLLFDRYELPASGKLFLYDRARTQVVGAFTRETRQPNGMLAVQPVIGDELWIEYEQAAGDPGRLELRVGEAVHDYLGILDELRVDSPMAMMGSGCLVDVNCPQANRYYDIKSSVIMVLMGGGLCSAGMLNNTANDGTPYFLTANHCGDMTNVVAVFDYEKSECETGTFSQSRTVSGATLLAASPQYDSQLYRLSAPPPQSHKPFYAGWDRHPVQPKRALSISHPSGAPRKFARDDQSPKAQTTRYQVMWELGKLEGGSSGSPLFNNAKRVIGPACCVTSFACASQTAWYGRFDLFWTTQNLAQWLDPLGADPLTLDGFEPFRGQAFPYNGRNLNPDIYFSTSPPSVGTTWTAWVDGSEFDLGMMTSIIGHTDRRPGVIVVAGELLVRLSSPRVFTSLAPAPTGPGRHSNPIPNIASLIGVTVYTQGLMIIDGDPTYTNAVELRLR
ncbi:MAG: trypsin-like peptidase domain-containing protein [Planctomycetes bacterium]|nr:trypsin-like peptidase domain-containing protein [Planctomycetota bacterium]